MDIGTTEEVITVEPVPTTAPAVEPSPQPEREEVPA